MAVKPVPDGYHTATPYLVVKGAADAIEFYKKAFGAIEIFRMSAPDGRMGHAEIRIGDSPIMLADEFPEMGWCAPQSSGYPPMSLYLYVNDVDATTQKAVAAGAKELRPVKDQFYGDRSGSIADPFGHCWNIATHKEDVPPDELKRRSEAMWKQHAQSKASA
jgi:PhnB protein